MVHKTVDQRHTEDERGKTEKKVLPVLRWSSIYCLSEDIPWDNKLYTVQAKKHILLYLCSLLPDYFLHSLPLFLLLFFLSLFFFFVSPTSLLGNQMNTVSQTNSVGFWPLDQTTVLTNISISLTLRDVSLSPHSINYDFSDLGWFH